MKLYNNRGSATIEACFTIPIFLFFFLAIASMIMMFFAEAHIHQSLAASGDVISRYCYINQEKKVSDGVYYLLLKKEFTKFIGNDYFVEQSVSGGKKGVHLVFKRDNDNEKVFCIKAVYKIKIYLPILGSFYTKRSVFIKQKGFVGFTKDEEEIDTYVYITPNQEVYHCSRNCTHLSLSVREVNGNNRSLYEPCHYCRYATNDNGTIYVARTGNVYHESRMCSGLKRSVTRVKKSSVMGLPPCKRCGR